MNILEGKVTALDRTSHVSGTDSRTSTTHIAIFKLDNEPILLRSSFPPMINEGDYVKVVGEKSPGQFTAIACKNITTNWMTPVKCQTGAKFGLSALIIFTLLFSLFGSIFIFMPLILTYLLYRVIKHDSMFTKANKLLG